MSQLCFTEFSHFLRSPKACWCLYLLSHRFLLYEYGLPCFLSSFSFLIPTACFPKKFFSHHTLCHLLPFALSTDLSCQFLKFSFSVPCGALPFQPASHALSLLRPCALHCPVWVLEGVAGNSQSRNSKP